MGSEICGISLTTIADYAGRVLDLVNLLPEHKCPERKGVYLNLTQRSTGDLLAVIRVGTFEDPKFARNCFTVAGVKIQMLLIDQGAISTWQLRNRDLGFYGGGIGIIAQDLAISASGSDEHGDEAVCVGLSLMTGWHNEADAGRIYDISRNPLIAPMQKLINSATGD